MLNIGDNEIQIRDVSRSIVDKLFTTEVHIEPIVVKHGFEFRHFCAMMRTDSEKWFGDYVSYKAIMNQTGILLQADPEWSKIKAFCLDVEQVFPHDQMDQNMGLWIRKKQGLPSAIELAEAVKAFYMEYHKIGAHKTLLFFKDVLGRLEEEHSNIKSFDEVMRLIENSKIFSIAA